MRKKLAHKISLFLIFLVAIIVCLITACNSKIQRLEQRETSSAVVQTNQLSPQRKPIATKIVSHALGRVEIPIHPQRIVVLDNSFFLDPLSALDIKPVGVATCFHCIPVDTLTKFTTGIPTVGHWEHPSIEKILSLKPDLILGHSWQKNSYELLCKIAPTVLIDTDSEVDFKKNLNYLAEILNRKAQAKEILVEYDERIQKFQQKLGERLKTQTVSIVHLSGSTLSVYGSDINLYGQVMGDAGVQFIQAYQDLKGYSAVNIETLADWDADILFVSILLKNDAKSIKSLSFLQQPLWSTLKAVQSNRVYPLSWANAVVGPITANQFIDDLYKYFVEAS